MEGSDNYVYFGDGHMAKVTDFEEYTDDEDGIRYIKFYLVPSEDLIVKFKLRGFNDYGELERVYSTTLVSRDHAGIYRNRWSIDTDINGGSTPRSERLDKFTSVIDDLKRKLELEKSSRYVLMHELSEERLNKAGAIKLQSEIIKTVASARGRTEEGESYNEE